MDLNDVFWEQKKKTHRSKGILTVVIQSTVPRLAFSLLGWILKCPPRIAYRKNR